MIDATHPPPPEIIDCLHAQEVLRRLGFPSEQLFVVSGLVPGSGRCVSVRLQVDGKAWTWNLARTKLGDDELEGLWAEAAVAWNELPNDHDRWGFDNSEIKSMELQALMSIQNKGIAIPRRPSLGEPPPGAFTMDQARSTEFSCPFCGRKVIASVTTDDEAVTIHLEPPCEMFIRYDMVEFMELVAQVSAQRARQS